MLVDYDDSRLGPYSPVRLSALDASSYDTIPMKSGTSYKIWLSMPPQDPNVWTTKYNGKDTCDNYMAGVNAMSKAFRLTKKPVVDNVNGAIYLEGTAKSNATWSQANLPGAWDFLLPWYVGYHLFGQSWRGIKGVQYSKILDSGGLDAASSYQTPIPNQPSSPITDNTSKDTSSGFPKLFGINILYIAAAAAVVGGAVLLGKRKRS
jgi:hypothetical protein